MALGVAALLVPAPRASSVALAVEVRFEGTRAIAAAELRRQAADELSALEDPSRRRAGAEDAAYRIEQAYRRAGHHFADVSWRTEDSPAEAVVFTVSEGPHVGLGELALEGNRSFNDDRLRALLAPEPGGPFVEADLLAGADRIRDLYFLEGFLEAEVEPPRIRFSQDRRRAAVRLVIREGARSVIRGVVVDGPVPQEASPRLGPLLAILAGQPLRVRRVTALRGQILELLGDAGYPDADVTVAERPGTSPGDVVLRVGITPGPRVRIGEVRFEGNRGTGEAFLKRRLGIREGEWYSARRLRDRIRELYATGLFARVDHHLDRSADTADRTLTIVVEELPSRELGIEVGWGSYELLRGLVDYRDANLFGGGRAATIEAGASTKSARVGGSVSEPRFLGTAVSARLPLSWQRREEPAFTRDEVAAALHFSRDLPGGVKGSLSYGLRYSRISAVDPEAEERGLGESYRLASLKAQLVRDTRDDLFYPARGGIHTLSAEVAGRDLGGELSFWRFVAGSRTFLPVGWRTVVGLRLDAGIVLPRAGQESIPLGERFFVGGENSVRSFGESRLGPRLESGDPVGGLGYTVASVELRQRLSGSLAVTLFADAGTVSPNRSEDAGDAGLPGPEELIEATLEDFFRGFRTALGVGVQYLLPVGPARLDVAWNPDRREGEAAARAHFSIGMSF